MVVSGLVGGLSDYSDYSWPSLTRIRPGKDQNLDQEVDNEQLFQHYFCLFTIGGENVFLKIKDMNTYH